MAESPPDAMLVAMLTTLAAAVLLVACGNVAGLLTSRAPVRAREMALRLAIGAGRGRLIRQLVTENLIVAIAGGALGLAVGYAGMMLFSQIRIPSDLPIMIAFDMDRRALLFSLAVAVASALVFGLVPAIQAFAHGLDLASRSVMRRPLGRVSVPSAGKRDGLLKRKPTHGHPQFTHRANDSVASAVRTIVWHETATPTSCCRKAQPPQQIAALGPSPSNLGRRLATNGNPCNVLSELAPPITALQRTLLLDDEHDAMRRGEIGSDRVVGRSAVLGHARQRDQLAVAEPE